MKRSWSQGWREFKSTKNFELLFVSCVFNLKYMSKKEVLLCEQINYVRGESYQKGEKEQSEFASFKKYRKYGRTSLHFSF